ncbi:MAG: serine/threonine protein kinase [Clostridiales bacterium]|nr:serine/threonine protein kinase [Clostridiales bacterium]
MYIDSILLIIGGAGTLLALLLIGYLVTSRGRSKVYRSVLQQETELLTSLTTTLSFGMDSQTTGNTCRDRGELPEGEADPKDPPDFPDCLTDLLPEAAGVIPDFDPAVLEGRYILKSELYRGKTSRIFLAESAKLENLWVVKFIPKQSGQLENEKNSLKLLNHISLPKIVDIFEDDNGAYIVESFIEGVSLDNLLRSGQQIAQSIIADWAEQMAQVLNYLHSVKPHPICHFDLKPSNIMVTHDNRLVLIDFGISKLFGKDDEAATGLTYKYAAPEQIKHHIPTKHLPLIINRFGELPADWPHWFPDARTDIYSLGVILFELAVGEAPVLQNINGLKNRVSADLSAIISKCLVPAPALRYQTAAELLIDLQKVKSSKAKIIKNLFIRKAAAIIAAATLILSGGSFAGGFYMSDQENRADLIVKPEIATTTLQRSIGFEVIKHFPRGKTAILRASQIRWSFLEDDIAQVDGNHILPLHLGKTELLGEYRNKQIKLDIQVVEPMDGMVDISLRYRVGHTVEIFAGSAEREGEDVPLAEVGFVSPESIAVADNGAIYLADSRYLRKIQDGMVKRIELGQNYLTPKIIRCYKNEVFVVTHEWKDVDGMVDGTVGGLYYDILRLTDEGRESVYLGNAKYTAVEDFAFSPDGLLYFIERNAGVNGVFLKTLNPTVTNDIYTLCELPKGSSSLTLDDDGRVYIANPEAGTIQVWQEGQLSYFAGSEQEKAFVDGTDPLFYLPQKIKWANDFLFIWDFNVLRCLSVMNGVAGECLTLIGEANPSFDREITVPRQVAEKIILPNSKLMDYLVMDDRVLLTDPKRGVIWQYE